MTVSTLTLCDGDGRLVLHDIVSRSSPGVWETCPYFLVILLEAGNTVMFGLAFDPYDLSVEEKNDPHLGDWHWPTNQKCIDIIGQLTNWYKEEEQGWKIMRNDGWSKPKPKPDINPVIEELIGEYEPTKEHSFGWTREEKIKEFCEKHSLGLNTELEDLVDTIIEDHTETLIDLIYQNK